MASGSILIARHGETVFNAAARMQGENGHTPLTRTGFAQAEAMGIALREHLGAKPALTLWSSPAGRALQTLAIIAEHLELDWHAARIDARLTEMGVGDWTGLYYDDVEARAGPIIDPRSGLFCQRPPGGEWYDGVAARLQKWLDAREGEEGDCLVVMHGLSSRVLRGMLTHGPHRPECGAPVADGLPQGSVVAIEDGVENLIHNGAGKSPH